MTAAAVSERIEQGEISKHVTISPHEAANRLAIRELVEFYAHCADRRDAKGQMPPVSRAASQSSRSLCG
jgi:hypothetical protein